MIIVFSFTEVFGLLEYLLPYSLYNSLFCTPILTYLNRGCGKNCSENGSTFHDTLKYHGDCFFFFFFFCYVVLWMLQETH